MSVLLPACLVPQAPPAKNRAFYQLSLHTFGKIRTHGFSTNSLSDIPKVPRRLIYDPFEHNCDTLATEFWYLIVNVCTTVHCFQFPPKCFTRSNFEMMTLAFIKGKQSNT